jgi:ribulose-5-phosphate 4-epimerase/fuculose-1-phosphate aldolase
MSEIEKTEPTDEATIQRSTVAAIKAELVVANKILLQYGIVDAFGHVSARHPVHADRFLMSRRIAPGLVSMEDIREFGLNGELREADGTPVYLERFIHSEIYVARPDVQAVVHSHSSAIVAFGIVDQPLRPVCHTCGFLNGGAPVFEIRQSEGCASNLMIDSMARGKALVRSLGDESVVLMRGHGSTAVGPTISRAVYRAIYTETNARIQSTAASMGKVNYLTPEEAAAAEKLGDLQVERTWEFWKMQIADDASANSPLFCAGT